MSVYISDKLRQKVKERANGICEYCLIHEQFLYSTIHVDHILSLKHGGKSTFENLAYCCSRCNRNKGTDLGSVLDQKGNLIRFFNPRIEKWSTHFSLNDCEIIPLTSIGEVTLKIFLLNESERIEERKWLTELDLFPYPGTPNI